MAELARHEEHFESLERQAQAARLGMWIFVASEVLFFGALFALYGAYRAVWPEAFHAGVRANALVLGTTNTVLLLGSSFLVALAVERLRRHHDRAAKWLVVGTLVVGIAFLSIKGWEYSRHFEHGIFPGGRGRHFEQAGPGQAAFFTLYYLLTGLHALHVGVGVGVMAVLARRIHVRTLTSTAPHGLEVGAMYWHLVDIIWLFLWPMFYLTRGGGGS